MKKKFLLISSILLTLVAFSAQAWALTLSPTDSYYLGYWWDGSPASDSTEAYVVNQLISMVGNTTYNFTASDLSGSLLGDSVTRSENTFSSLSTAVFSEKNDTPSLGSIDVTGIDYILAKYDGSNYGSEVWYVGDWSGSIDLPSALGGSSNDKYGISHYSLFTGSGGSGGSGGNTVPEPATLTLFGIGLLGLAKVSRRKKIIQI